MAASKNNSCWRSVPCTLLLALALLLLASTNAIPRHSSRLLVPLKHWGQPSVSPLTTRIITLRGGSSVDEEVEEADTDDDGEEEEDEEEEEEEVDSGVQIEMNVEKYDEPLAPSPMLNMYASIGVMLLARKVDLFSPTIVRLARFAFVAFLVCYQLFLVYARIQAVSQNDRTPIELKSPLSSMLQSQLGGGDEKSEGGNAMMKTLASSFLSSKSTVVEYDLKQIRSMQSGMIFNMLFMWVLHFKMGQVQPLIIQSITGLANLIYSPLFQVYGFGRNLERPFKTAAAAKQSDTPVPETEAISNTDSVEDTDEAEDETEEEEDTDAQEAVEEGDDEEDEGPEEDESVLVDDE